MHFSQYSLLCLCMSSANAFVHQTQRRTDKTFANSKLSMMMDVPSQPATGTYIDTDANMSIQRILNNPSSTATNSRSQPTLLSQGIRDFLVPPAFAAESKPKPPSNDEIKLLREALGTLYGERNPDKALELLTKAVASWERQAPDERAALFRVRGDCYMVRRGLVYCILFDILCCVLYYFV